MEFPCQCHKCIEKTIAESKYKEMFPFRPMILCSVCGNKRCPKATDHDLECTNSNEPGQKGSVYE